LPPVAEHEIRLVTWMAIKGTNQSHIISKAR
jgi:hypothetical protein